MTPLPFIFLRVCYILFNERSWINLLFTKKFEIVEIRESGAIVKHFLKGDKQKIEEDINMFKRFSKNYEMVGKNGMVVWV